MKVKASRKATFNAAHRLFRPDWDEEKNNAVFGNVIGLIWAKSISIDV